MCQSTDHGVNAPSAAPSVEASLGSGSQSTSVRPPSPAKPPLRRSPRLSALSAKALPPPQAMHANSVSAAPSAETTPGLGFQSTSALPPSPARPPLRRSPRLSALSAKTQSPPAAVHASPASAAPSAVLSSEIRSQENTTTQPAQQHFRRCTARMSTGGKVPKHCLAPPFETITPLGNRKRVQPPSEISQWI